MAKYRAIVIVAHSQGTIISADLLRYLSYQKRRGELDTALEPLFSPELPIYLMTFGSPLRQLYDLRFPDLYAWTFRSRHAVNEGPHAHGKIGLRDECCLGEGAHTHYFDETSPLVPVWLNRVISDEIGGELNREQLDAITA